MKGDFSRWTFDATKQYSRLLSLQGRVFLDADFNEAQELQLRHVRKLTADLIGPHAGAGTAFTITTVTTPQPDLAVAAGTYYVNGIPCVAGENVRFTNQPFLPSPMPLPQQAGRYIVYLDVWERYVTYVEDLDRTPQERGQSIREVALGGPDTAGRSQVVWQLRFLPAPGDGIAITNDNAGYELFRGLLQKALVIPNRAAKLAARARKPVGEQQPCSTNPESKYRGPENQLYRVEVHTSGAFPPAAGAAAPTFKWSRENGSVIFPIRSLEGPMVTLDSLGPDDRLGLHEGDWVEVVDDHYVLQNRAEPLLQVKKIDRETMEVELSATPASAVGQTQSLHPILRRWEGTAPITQNPDPDSGGFLHLEDGVEVRFSGAANQRSDYRTGDYWIIPARTATGDVEWPGPAGAPIEVAPHGIEHSYAPLAVVNIAAAAGGAAGLAVQSPMRRTIAKLWE